MKTYVFVFENAEPIMTLEGVECPTSFAVQADSYGEAIAKLAQHCSQLNDDYSNEQADYHDDIEEGNITVLCPTKVG